MPAICSLYPQLGVKVADRKVGLDGIEIIYLMQFWQSTVTVITWFALHFLQIQQSTKGQRSNMSTNGTLIRQLYCVYRYLDIYIFHMYYDWIRMWCVMWLHTYTTLQVYDEWKIVSPWCIFKHAMAPLIGNPYCKSSYFGFSRCYQMQFIQQVSKNIHTCWTCTGIRKNPSPKASLPRPSLFLKPRSSCLQKMPRNTALELIHAILSVTRMENREYVYTYVYYIYFIYSPYIKPQLCIVNDGYYFLILTLNCNVSSLNTEYVTHSWRWHILPRHPISHHALSFHMVIHLFAFAFGWDSTHFRWDFQVPTRCDGLRLPKGRSWNSKPHVWIFFVWNSPCKLNTIRSCPRKDTTKHYSPVAVLLHPPRHYHHASNKQQLHRQDTHQKKNT